MKSKLCTAFISFLFTSGPFLLCICAEADPSLPVSSPDGQLMVCYYTATRYFPVSKVQADICTHIIYSYGVVSPAGIKPSRSGDVQVYKALAALKQTNPKLKVMLSLQPGFPSVVDEREAVMINFSVSAVSSMKQYNFDGIDLDWEYPKESQRSNYDKFIKILSSHLKKENMLLAAALPNNPYHYKKGYVTSTFNTYMDFMTAMTYDFHVYSKADHLTGYNSPLHPPKGEMAALSTAGMIEFYLKAGILPNKLLLGLPLYGRSWALASPDQHGLHAPAVGKGGPSPFAHLPAIYIYPDTCVALQQGATQVNDTTAGAVYLYHGSTWVAFDNEDTIKTKIAYMKSHNLGGVGIWAMHIDDLPGVCKQGPLPLLKFIKSNL